MAESIIGKFVNLIRFQVDDASVQQTKSAISVLRSFALKTVGAIGIGLSLSGLRQVTEEFNGINDLIRGTTRELGGQVEIQQKILSAANDVQESYGAMAQYVTDIVQQNQDLFPVDDAIHFAALVEKLEKGAGRESNLGSTMSLLNRTLASGSLDNATLVQLERASPEVVNTIAEAMGVSRKQLETLASAGQITSQKLKDVFFAAEGDINLAFGELDYNFSALGKHIRNSWGYFIEDQIDSTYGLTNKLAKTLRDLNDFILGKVQIVANKIYDLTERMGGIENLLKLIGVVAAAFFTAFKGDMILDVLKGAAGLLSKINLQSTLATAKFLMLLLMLDDIWIFLQGGDSVIGRLFTDAGVDVDNMRENISSFFDAVKQLCEGALDRFSEFWQIHGDTIQQILGFLWDGIADLIADLIAIGTNMFNIFAGLLVGFQTGDWTQFLDGLSGLWSNFLDIINGIGQVVFGNFWNTAEQALSFIWTGIVDLVTALIETGGNFFNLIIGLISGFLTGDWTQFLDGLSGLWSNFLDIINGMGQVVFGTIWNPLKEGAQAVWDFLEGFVDWFGDKFSAIGNFLSGVQEKAGQIGRKLTYFMGENGNNATAQVLAAGGGVSAQTVMSAPLSQQTTMSKIMTIKQENNQTYTFHVSEREVAERLQRETSRQSDDSTDAIARALEYRGD